MKMNKFETLYESIKESLLGKYVAIIAENSDYSIREIKHLSTDGKEECPAMVYVAKGEWYKNVKINEGLFDTGNKEFTFGEGVADEQYGLPKYKGGIIVFSTDVNAVNDPKGFKNKVKAFFKNNIQTIINRITKNKKLNKLITKHNVTRDVIKDHFIGAFSIGNFFKGRYIGKNDKVYDGKSSSIEIAGVPSEVLLIFGTEIAKEFKQETVLIKDLNKNKFYLADRKDVKDINKEVEKI